MRRASPFATAVRRELGRNAALYAPLRVDSLDLQPKEGRNAFVQLSWNNRKQAFVVELKARSAPRMVQEAIRTLKTIFAKGRDRLLVVPYLSPVVVELVQSEGISALDLNGNYFIQTKAFLAIRLDRPNRYKESQPIKQIYSGRSSIVGRFLLMKKTTYRSVNELFYGIKKLGVLGGNDPLSLPTVSKVLKGLEEELILEKKRDEIRLVQPDKLLDRLRDGYRPPKVTDELKLKLPDAKIPWGWRESGVFITSGESSLQRYATTTSPQVYTVYVVDLPKLVATTGIRKYEEDRFPNLILRETADAYVYLNDPKEFGWATPVQTYLELSRLDKREKEIAEEVRKVILEPFR